MRVVCFLNGRQSRRKRVVGIAIEVAFVGLNLFCEVFNVESIFSRGVQCVLEHVLAPRGSRDGFCHLDLRVYSLRQIGNCAFGAALHSALSALKGSLYLIG